MGVQPHELRTAGERGERGERTGMMASLAGLAAVGRLLTRLDVLPAFDTPGWKGSQ